MDGRRMVGWRKMETRRGAPAEGGGHWRGPGLGEGVRKTVTGFGTADISAVYDQCEEPLRPLVVAHTLRLRTLLECSHRSQVEAAPPPPYLPPFLPSHILLLACLCEPTLHVLIELRHFTQLVKRNRATTTMHRDDALSTAC